MCLSAPEHARTNFSRAILTKVAEERLVGPWNELAATLAKLTAELGDNKPLPVSPQARAQAAAMITRFSLCYELESFSLSRAADLIVQYTERLRQHADRALAPGLDRDLLSGRLGDLFLQLRALLSGASPILIDLAARAGIELSMSAEAYQLTHTAAVAVPVLDLSMPTPNEPEVVDVH
jgi:methionyl-tRNA synthetase